jgi:hypothetical protein
VSDPIAGAKKDLEGMKSARESALHPKSGGPRIRLPDLPSTAAPLVVPKAPALPRDPKPASWLVDAMEKQKESRESEGLNPRARQRGGKDRRDQEYPETGDEVGAGEMASRERARAREQRKDLEPGSLSVVVNPLTAFLGEWMTPQDYALLKPGLTPGSDLASGLSPAAGLNPANTVAGAGPTSEVWQGASAFKPMVSPPPPRENPFLQSLQPDSQVPSGSPVRNVVPPSVAVPAHRAPIPPSPAPIPPARSKIPDFAKPPTDDKYFKQLNRF